MDRRDAIKLMGLGLFAAIVGCNKDIKPESSEDENEDYIHIRESENERVENLLKQYACGSDGTYERLNIAFMTDSHIDLGPIPKESKRNVKDAIDFCNSSLVPITAIIHGGDLVTQIKGSKREHMAQLKEFFDMAWNSKMPLLFTKGNHDLNAINVSPEDAMTDKDWSSVWYDKAEKAYGIVRNTQANGLKSGYYYYDLEKWKIRIISVDCFDVDLSKTNLNNEILYWAGTSYYIANEQFNWIVNTALNFDDKENKDWGVIVFMHFYRPLDKDGTSVDPIFESVFGKFNSMLHAFNTQSACLVNYSFLHNSFYNLEVKGDWTRYAGVDKKPYLIGVLSGHVHTDVFVNWQGTNHLVTANQYCGMRYSDERIERSPWTRTQNLFDILNIDLKEKRLRVIRYGASANLDGKGGNRYLEEGISFSQ